MCYTALPCGLYSRWEAGSVAMLQRRFNVGYARAWLMIKEMTARGILEESQGVPRRRLAMTQAEYEAERAG